FPNFWKLKATSKSIVMFEVANAKPLDLTEDHVHCWDWFKKSTVLQGKVWDSVVGDVQVDRHGGQNYLPISPTDANRPVGGGGSHYLYADGHVELISEIQIHTWTDTPFNFAVPPEN